MKHGKQSKKIKLGKSHQTGRRPEERDRDAAEAADPKEEPE